MTRAFVFPGQGSQTVGMGTALADAFPAARDVFAEVDDALSQKLFALMAEGPDGDLTLTENAQPALMAVSLAVVRVLEAESGRTLAELGGFVAGHSLGEYSALCAAGSLELSDTARLLRKRGQAMQQAVPVGDGAMAAILGPDLETVEAIAEDAAADGVCQVANDNAPGQVVVSGHTAAVERAAALAKEKGAKRAVMLPVSAPFHCTLMAPAADAMAEALAAVGLRAPAPKVVQNVAAEPGDDPDAIRSRLVDQVTGRVRWRECVSAMKAGGAETTVELGTGKVLTGLTKRIEKEMSGVAVGTPEDVDVFLKSL